MRFLGRSTAADSGSSTPDESATAVPDATQVDPSRTAGKGRATPKRRDVQAKRRGPAPPPPKTQREAAKLAKANRPDKNERRRLAAERRARMAAGDDRVLLPRDRGPVKAYIRDVVDSRPHLMGLFMPLAGLVLLSAVFPVIAVQQYMSLFSLVALLVMITEGVLLGMSTARKVRAKFPDEQIGGLSIGWYAFTRASQLRRLRVPKPRVKRGAQV
ncbi:DUF3043 domain-containing protein [Pseudonocardia sp. CA-107938]|uniref:DUF3043 domain-containing protein n=1 Tax=Pseudonocardia sp. CA-107938 TaxID=3240021 RepID=UPI003D8EC137